MTNATLNSKWTGKPSWAVLALLALLLTVSSGGLSALQPEGLLPKKVVKALLANAKTPQDHLKLARHFAAKAAQHEAEAKEHEVLAAEYRRRPTIHETKHPMSPQTAAHCDYYAEHCRKAAAELRSLAAAHDEMAGKGSR